MFKAINPIHQDQKAFFLLRSGSFHETLRHKSSQGNLQCHKKTFLPFWIKRNFSHVDKCRYVHLLTWFWRMGEFSSFVSIIEQDFELFKTQHAIVVGI